MKTVRLVVFALFLTSPVIGQQPPPAEIAKVGRALVEQLDRRDYATIHARFNPRLQKALPADKLRLAWEKVQVKAGRLRTIGEPIMTTKNRLRHLVYPSQFEHRRVDVEVVFNPDGEVSGVLFHPKR